MKKLATLLAFAVTLTATVPLAALTGQQSETTGELYGEIASMDARLTESFNRHDVEALMSLFSPDLEFYHDTGGLQLYADVEAGFESLFSKGDGIRRELVPNSMRVYPIKGYGAVQVGEHRFCHIENGHEDCGTFEFLQIWVRSQDSWKISRVVSYGH